MARCERENPNARNFGLRSKDMSSAGRNALREGMQSQSSIKTISDRFNQFVEYSREEFSIRDMRKLELSHIRQYGEHLREKCENGSLSPATAQNYLSAVNRVLELARGDKTLNVSPVRDAGIPQRSGICTEKQSPDFVTRENTVQNLSERLSVQIELQRLLGLRFEESCKVNAISLSRQAQNKSIIAITDGTKGGRSRTVPIVSKEQRDILQKAASIQGRHHSLIPAQQSYKAYRQTAYDALRQTQLKGFHGNRHEYAHNRYEQLTGCACPVIANVQHGQKHIQFVADQKNISFSQAKVLDSGARLQIARELGHNRIEITNAYLG